MAARPGGGAHEEHHPADWSLVSHPFCQAYLFGPYLGSPCGPWLWGRGGSRGLASILVRLVGWGWGGGAGTGQRCVLPGKGPGQVAAVTEEPPLPPPVSSSWWGPRSQDQGECQVVGASGLRNTQARTAGPWQYPPPEPTPTFHPAPQRQPPAPVTEPPPPLNPPTAYGFAVTHVSAHVRTAHRSAHPCL